MYQAAAICWLSFAGGVLLLLRLPMFALDQYSPFLASVFPEWPKLESAGSDITCATEALCGPKLCGFKGKSHLGWMVPLLSPTYYLPNVSIHFFLMFVVNFVVPRPKEEKLISLVFVFLFLTGPFAAHWYAAAVSPEHWRKVRRRRVMHTSLDALKTFV